MTYKKMKSETLIYTRLKILSGFASERYHLCGFASRPQTSKFAAVASRWQRLKD